jgi:hypothetical protein
MSNLETRVSEALTADASRAPVGSPTWFGPNYTEASRKHVRGGTRRTLMALAAVAAVSIAALGVALRRDEVQRHAGGFTPAGVEYPLTDLGEPTYGAFGLTVSALARVTQVPGQPRIVSGPTLNYSGGPTAEIQWCDAPMGGGAGCAPDWLVSVPRVGQTSSVDNHHADFDVWTWSNVPTEASFVTFTQGNIRLWQRPVHGMVQFPVAHAQPGLPSAPEETVALDSAGNELARADTQSVYEAGTKVTNPSPQWADITASQGEAMHKLTDTTLRTCLSKAGATYSDYGTVAFLPTGADAQSVWNACVTETKAAVSASLHEINPRYYDPSKGERPMVDDPMQKFEDPVNQLDPTTTTG